MTVRPKRKRDPAVSTTEIIQWMQEHTIGDLNELATATESRGGDATTLWRLLTDLRSLQTDLIESNLESSFDGEDQLITS